MEDPNSPEAVAKRANQEDPIVMYLVVRESLNMSIGKTAAQCAHASQMLTLKYFSLKDAGRTIQRELAKAQMEPRDRIEGLNLYKEMGPFISIFGEWLQSSFRKVVLGADNKSWEKIKLEFKDQNMILVVDAGLTEIPSGSETVIGIWPMRKSQRPKILAKLQVLK